MNFNHRLKGHDLKSIEANNLSDVINGMTDRARASVSMLQDNFTGEHGSRVGDETAYNALEAVYMELVDIQKVVFEFHKTQKSPEK